MTNNNEELNQAKQEQNQSLEQTPNLAEGTIENNLEETKELDPRENSEESVNSKSEEDNVETVTNAKTRAFNTHRKSFFFNFSNR